MRTESGVSERDGAKYGPLLRSFVGERVFACLATNSLKLMIGARERGAPYVWADPPWRLLKGASLLAASADVPHHAEPGYVPRFAGYARRLSVVDGTFLEGVELTGATATLALEGGMRVALDGPLEEKPVAGSPEPDGERRYDDWYAAEGAGSSGQGAEPRGPVPQAGRRGRITTG